MDIYKRKSRWKIYLALAGLLVFFVSLIYSNYLAEQLATGERNKAQVLFQALQSISNDSLNELDHNLALDIVLANDGIPIIATSPDDEIEVSKNFPVQFDSTGNYSIEDMELLRSELEKIKSSGPEPIPMLDPTSPYLLYYKNSRLLNLLTFFPLIQLLLLSAFIGIGYYGFSAARKGEQNRVWAGMAKETAHQLGTPISAIIGWIEHLKSSTLSRDEQSEVIGELRNDVVRLELIADRFSKIGSDPKLEPTNVFKELEKNRAYMQRRSSRKIVYEFPDPNQEPLFLQINPPLFDWVIENLLRNALDAMGGEGKISATVTKENNMVTIDITDTGKGIPASNLKTVFKPGFTTKTRGWGLGLSLAKRIIENYHKGKIFVKESKPDKGTTFSIRLPL